MNRQVDRQADRQTINRNRARDRNTEGKPRKRGGVGGRVSEVDQSRKGGGGGGKGEGIGEYVYKAEEVMGS